MVAISVVMPIGPHVTDTLYLQQAIQSLNTQTQLPAELIIIDDMAHPYDVPITNFPVHIIYNKWLMGVAHSFNLGVAHAHNNCVLMMGADDWLEPECLAECSASYIIQLPYKREVTYYWLGVRYSDGREDQYLPCAAAMVTRNLWKSTGGFPVESASGASDAAYISMLLGNKGVALLYCVNEHKPLYNYRVHSDTDTSRKGAWQGVILETRGILTSMYSNPEWGRYE